VIRRELHRIDKRHSLFVALVGHGDNLALFILSLPANRFLLNPRRRTVRLTARLDEQ